MGLKSRGKQTVARGLQLCCAGVAVLAVAFVVPPGAASWLGLLLEFIGRTCCLAVPRESRCLGLVRASVLCSLIPFALMLMLVALFPHYYLIVFFIVFFAAPLTVLAHVLFLIAVRRLAGYLGQPRLASAARSILIAGLCTLAFLIGWQNLPMALDRLFPFTGQGNLFSNPWWRLIMQITRFAMRVLLVTYAYAIYRLGKAVVDHDDSRGVRPDEAEHAGTKPGPNADIEKLLELYDGVP